MSKLWPHLKLRELFSINREQVFPAQFGKDEFIHYSIPSWDETGGPAIEIGSSIESNKTLINKPSVLVSKLNPRKSRVSVVNSSDPRRQCCSTEFICYQPKDKNECLDYWALYFASNDFKSRLEKIAIGSTNSHTRANPKETLEWSVPNPPICEKIVISKIFREIDINIRQTEAIIEKLKQIKQGLLHDLLTRGIDDNGELRPPPEVAPELYRESKLGLIPKGWKVMSVGEALKDSYLFEIQDGNHGELHPKQSDFRSEGVPFIMANDLKSGLIDIDGCYKISHKQYSSLRVGFTKPKDVLLSHKGTIGNLAIVPDELEEAMLTPQVTYYRCNINKILNKYLYSWFNYHKFVGFMLVLSAQSTRSYLGVLGQRQLFIAIPEMEEQFAISNAFLNIENSIRTEIVRLKKLEKQKSGLMDDLLTGRVRVTPLLAETSPISP